MDNEPEWKVLLIDLDEDDFVIFQTILGAGDGPKFSLQWSQNPQAARQALQQQKFDAVLMDHHLGHENGIDVIQSMAQAGVTLPMILLYEKGSNEVDQAVLAARGLFYIYKIELSPQLLERTLLSARKKG